MNPPHATQSGQQSPGEPIFSDGVSPAGVPIPSRFRVRRVAETASTNDDLLAAGLAGADDGLVLVADHQTAGRGRLDRHWRAEPGANLLVSMLFRQVPRYPHQLTHAMALAAQAAANEVAGVRVKLKWPNDLLVDQRKIAGILSVAGGGMLSRGDAGSGPAFVVVGLGLNVNWAPPDAASLAGESGGPIDRLEVLARLLVALDRLLNMSETQLFDRYRSRLDTLRRDVRVELPNDVVMEGRALDVEVDGRLVVQDRSGVTHRLDIGDVVHLRRIENNK